MNPTESKVFEAYSGMYHYKLLPRFAQFILENHLDDFVREQIRLSHKINLPLLKTLAARFSDEQLFQISIASSTEYLTYLKLNQAYDQIKGSMKKWLQDQLEVIAKFQIASEDITLLNYIREQSFKKLIPLFTANLQDALELSSEIDTLLLGATTTAVENYVQILKVKIEEESNLSRKVIEASPAITFVFDLVENKEVFVSGKVAEVMGYTPEELLNMGENVLLQLTHPDDLHIIHEHLEKLIINNNNETDQLEYRFKHKDGSYKWLRSYEVVFKRDKEGNPIQLLGKTFEITKEKETALSLQKRERQLLEAQALAHIGSFEWNIRENRSVNTAEVYKIFEMEADQKFEEFMSHVHPEDLKRVQDALNQSFTTGVYDCEYRYLKREKEKVIWSLGKVEFESEKPVRMVGTIQDITEIKRIEKELVHKTNELERSNDSLQQFAYVASHDLKEPIRKISMFTEMVASMEKDNIAENSKLNLTKIQNASKVMQRMVDDILSFSLLQAKEEKKLYSLQHLINEVVELLDQTIQEKGATVIYKELPEVYITPSQFRQLFQNLISNSLKFAKKDPPPEVTINYKWLQNGEVERLKPAEKYLELKVSDNGIGFPNEWSEKIFELFKRLHSKSQYEGTGLGLTISKRIVENHDGLITAESIPEKGATFTIVIPQ